MNFYRTSLCSLFLAVFLNSAAQSGWQNWNSIDVRAGITKKLTLRSVFMQANQLDNGIQPIFSQAAFRASYSLKKRLSLHSGVQFFLSPVSGVSNRIRLHVRAEQNLDIAEKIKWSNAVLVETNSSNENRFRHRISITSKIGLKRRIDFLNLMPSASYSLFYNIGGGLLRYYDESGSLIIRQSPDGFHRGRFMLNLNSKINEYLRISMYYMRQDEFNFLVPDTRKINVYDPVRNRILRPFNNFNTLGINLQIVLDNLFDY